MKKSSQKTQRRSKPKNKNQKKEIACQPHMTWEICENEK